MKKQPRDYQIAGANALWSYVHTKHGTNPLVLMPTGCHAEGHPILMFDGTVKRVEEVVCGDLLMGPDSRPRRVMALARGRQGMRRITPVKGEPFVVNEDHILHLKKVKEKSLFPSQAARYENKPVGLLERQSDWYRHLRKLVRASALEFPDNGSPLPISPYFLGLLIGDGFLYGGGVSVSGVEPELREEVYRQARLWGLRIREVCGKGTKCVTYHLAGEGKGHNRLGQACQALGLMGQRSGGMFVPDCYKTASRTDRLAILAGLLDSDGSLSNGVFDFQVISRRLAEDVVFIARSLGLAAYLTEGRAMLYEKDCGPSYRVTISGETIGVPTRFPGKQAPARRQIKDVLCTGFTIETLPEDDFYGFTLDGDHLYVDGYFIVHHNSGKSLTMAMFITGMVQTYAHLRFLSLTHVKELVAGNYRELMELWPTAPAGVYSAGLGRKDLHGQITFAGIDSIRNNIGRFGHIDFVVVDEAHRISDNEKSGYQKVFAALKARNPNLIVIGFTATGFRMGTGMLTDGSLFDEICFDLSSADAFVWMIQQRYLLRLVSKNPGIQVDESKVKIKAGEYDEKSASEAFRDQDILERAVDIMIAHAEEEGRRAWLTFAQSTDDAELLADMFRYKGYPVEAVHSKRGDRDDVLAKHRRGELIGVVNKDVLTTGYDDPRIDLIGVLRLTRSPGLWVQLLGRGTRPLWMPGYDISTWEGREASILASPKQNCRVLDFAGNILRLGPINYPTIPKQKKKGGGGPPVRECPECGTHNHISLKCCEECGYEFPVQQKIKEEASTQELVVDLNNLPPPPAKEYGVFRVDQMIAAQHKGRNGKPDSMRVDYFCGVRRFSKWVCLQHVGFPRTDAERWWRAHAGKAGKPPATVEEGVHRFSECQKPHYLKVWVNAKYPEIEAYDFEGLAFELPPELGGPPRALDHDTLKDAADRAEKDRVDALVKEMFDDDLPF